MEVHYCHICGTKVSSDAIDGGSAMRSAANRVICGTCVTDLKPVGAELPRSAARKVLPRRDTTHAHTHTHAPARESKPQGIPYFLGAIAILIAGMLVFFAPFKTSSSTNTPVHTEKVAAPAVTPASAIASKEQLPIQSSPGKSAAVLPSESPKASAQTVNREGLLAYWTFDDISGDTLKDASGHGHDAVLVNEPLPTPGKFGTALGFFGKQQYVNIKLPEKIELGASSFTFSAWIKTRGAGCLLSKTNSNGGWADQGKIIFIGEGSGRLRMDSHGVADYSGTTAVNDNNWHHVAVVFFHERKIIKMFVDGKEDGSFDMHLEADHANFDLRLGFGPSTSHTINFTGLMDDVALYARELTPAELESLAAAQKRP